MEFRISGFTGYRQNKTSVDFNQSYLILNTSPLGIKGKLEPDGNKKACSRRINKRSQ